MKDNEISELKISSCSNEDEISLVDVALVLIRHKFLIGFIFISCMGIGIAINQLKLDEYNYSTSIKIGGLINSQGIQTLESPETLQVKIERTFIPQLFNELNSHYSISVSIPKDSHIILLESTSTQEQDQNLIKALNHLAQKIEFDHEQIYSAIKNSLETQLKPENMKDYALQLASLQKTHAVSTPIQTITPTKADTKLVIAISAFIGLITGIFMAFFAEFMDKVKTEVLNRESAKENKQL